MPPQIPIGTKVLTHPGGRVGVIVDIGDVYLVRFPDGDEAEFPRSDLTIYRHAMAEIPLSIDAESLLPYVQYRCVVGSTAYGLVTESSDVDRRGFYLPPADLHWSLAGVTEQIETAHEEAYWEIEKFLRLALKANPNVLECLYTPLVEHVSPLAQELLAMREIFLSRHVHRTYNAYVLSQFKKLEQDLRARGQIRWKHVMHLIRLLLSGVTVLREGFIPLRVDSHRDRLLAIRRGEVAWEEVEEWRLDLHRRLDDALAATRLPEHPGYARADAFLVRARRRAASPEYVSG
ncbi:MAG TPA: nucleotidyltransferase domain-containing protein [Candidatus Solibacter sp.]|nr:nucleotidyltransferase domain-containing protein [Candidatus Solibacter sp.]